MEEPKTLQMKLSEMFNYIHVPEPMGNAATHALAKNIKMSQKPMSEFATQFIGFIKDKIDDKHTPLLLSVFCLLFNQVLFDPTVGCVVMSSKVDNNGNGKEEGK